ncbi:MAG: tripartite tricarboxylate transporter substrate binding protein [Synergistaceae bacterium]
MKNLNRGKRTVFTVLAVLCAAIFAMAPMACAEWPERPITMVVPFNPGGDTDFMGRTYSKFLQEELGQPVVVVNMAGAGGTAGAQHVADSKNDGYTLLCYHTGNLYPNKMRGVSKLDHNSFAIACLPGVDDTNVLVAGKDAGFKDAKDFLKKAKAAGSKKISAAVTASGYSCYVLANMEIGGGFSTNIVDCGGAADSIPMILGNHTQLGVSTYGVYKQYIDNGSMIALIAAGAKRNKNFPNVPTVKELGFKNSIVDRYYFMAFPKGTDPKIVNKLSDAVAKIQKKPEYANALKAYYFAPYFVPSTKATAVLENVWKQMEPFTDALNGTRK